MTYDDAAAHWDVGRASVSRWLSLWRRTGSVDPLPMGGSRPSLGEDEREVLKLLVHLKPDATLAELADWLEEDLGVRTNDSTLSRVLAEIGLTRKKRRSSTTAGWTRM